MQNDNPSSIIQSPLLPNDSHFIHGFTVKAQGDMRDPERRNTFFAPNGIDPSAIFYPRQIHGIEVTTIGAENPLPDLSRVDACIVLPEYPKRYAATVHVGDCAPVLFFDPVREIAATCHAGWKGTHARIASTVVRQMMVAGSAPSDIRVAIGPHIGTCCYDVDEQRMIAFADVYGMASIGRTKRGLHSLDLTYAIRSDLVESGIKEENIDTRTGFCTGCDPERFFSYRRKTESFGEMIGFIARIS
jgi:YfiH family protein